MYFQNNPKVNVFKRYGCYFFSLGHIAEKFTEQKLTCAQIWDTYALAVCSGWMRSNCYLLSPDKVLQHFMNILDISRKFKCTFTGWWNTDTGEQFFGDDVRVNAVINRFNYGNAFHFMTDDFNPYDGDSDKLGSLNGKRYFYIAERHAL